MRHVIVGTGPAGVVAAETLRGADGAAEIVLVGDEPGPPYSRMALPYLMSGQIEVDGTYLRRGEGHYDALRIERVEARVERVDAAGRRVVLESGDELAYDRLLVATGSRPRVPPMAEGLTAVRPCWTLEDARHLIDLAAADARAVLVGAGFVGCVLMDAFTDRGVQLTVVEQEEQILPQMLDPVGAGLVRRWCEEAGVRFVTGAGVEAIDGGGNGAGGLRLTAGGERLEANFAVLAAGIAPNVGLLEGSGVTVDGGVLVDDRLCTSVPEIYAAGDVARGPTLDGGRSVHAVQPVAADHGRMAALNMAGADARYGGGMAINLLDTFGLVSCSMGHWRGADDGERIEVLDEGRFRYLRLELVGDRILGAISVGQREHLGALRGLIQGRVALGEVWRERLRRDPSRVMEAYVARTLPA